MATLNTTQLYSPVGTAQVCSLLSKFDQSRGCSARDHSQIQSVTSGQAHTWPEHRASVYATAGATSTTASGTGVQQSGSDGYSQSPGTSTQDSRTDTHHHDSQVHGDYGAGLSSGSGHQQYDEVKRDPVASYPAPSTSSAGSTLYGALGGNQIQYNDGYGAQLPGPSKGTLPSTTVNVRS